MAETPLHRQYQSPIKRTKLALIAERRLRRQQGQRSNRFKFLLLAAFLVPIFMCSLAVIRLRYHDYQGDTARLQAVLPLLEKYKVEVYFNLDWCKRFSYRGGMFFESRDKDSADNCRAFAGARVAKPFDNQTRQDFELSAQALDATGIDIIAIEGGTFDDAGRVKYAEFHKDCVFCRTRYVYSPKYGKVPQSLHLDVWYEKINEDWYLADEDWN